MENFSIKQIKKNFLVLALSQYGGLVCNIGLSILLTRMLSPSDYGLIAQLLFYLILFNWVFEWGWDAAFMSHRELDLNEAASTHLIIRATLGIIPLFVFIFINQTLPNLISKQNLVILIFLCIAYWFEKVGLTYKTILERNYHLNKIASLEFLASITSYCVAVGCAYYHLGIYSLLMQRLTDKTINCIGYFILSPWKLGKEFKIEILKIFFKNFGIASWLGGVFGITIYDFMPFLIANISSNYQAGLYEKAFNLATFPMILTGIASRITVPLYTQYQFNEETLKEIFVKAQSIKMLILIPFQISLALFSPIWIPLILGNKWNSLIKIYQIMTIYGLFRSFFDDVPNIFTYGFKNPWELTKNQVMQSLLILVISPLLVFKFQAIGGSISISIMIFIATILIWRNVFFKLNCSARDFIKFIIQIPLLIKW